MDMDQSKANFVELLQHYDINDFTRFLAKKEFLSTYELKFLPGESAPKREIVSSLLSHVSSRNRFASLFEVFGQYKKFVSKDVARLTALMLPEIPSTRKHFSHDKTDSGSCSSSPPFSDDSDPAPFQASQECPTDIHEDLAPDSGYYTQGNSLSSELSGTVQLPVKAPSRQSKSMRPKSRHPARNVVYITNNFNVHQSPNQGFCTATDGPFQLQSPVYDKFQRVLQICHPELSAGLNVQTLLSPLYSQGLLTRREFETLQTGTQSDQNQSLLRMLHYKGEHAYEIFYKCLLDDKEHSSHAPLARLLSTTYPKDSIDV